jgi:superfamily II DNA or RNA helicase
VSQVAAGWFPDPGGAAQWRWWDGGQWTAHVAPYQRSEDDRTISVAAPAGVADEPLPWIESSGGTGRAHDQAASAAPPSSAEPPTSGSPADQRPPLADDPAPGRETRALYAELSAAESSLSALLAVPEKRKSDVLERLAPVRDELVQAHLATIPVARLRDATEGRLRLGAIADAGFSTVVDVLRASPSRLQTIPGVGVQTATQAFAAARHLAGTLEATIPIRFDTERRPAPQTELLRALRRYDDVDALVAPDRDEMLSLSRRLRSLQAGQTRPPGRLRWLFTGADRKAAFRCEVRRIDALLREPAVAALLKRVEAHLSRSDTEYDTAALWQDYQARAPDYYGLLGELADLSLDVAAVHGHLPTELAEQIAKQQLDLSHLTVSLRGYQSFGAKFALVQRRSIVGDEMGLGKTIEAIAAMAHLAALGSTHFLVVCPASVLVNWTREVRTRSRLTAHRIHAAERDHAFATWQKRGGVGVTTFETLRSLSPSDPAPALLVVDEAHFIKNPSAARSKATRMWTDHADRVLFLTGTAMENRVDEFRNLVGYLQPEITASIKNVSGIAGASFFRGAVAPVYLRRNQEDVLSELPERLDILDWVDLTQRDLAAYRNAVASRNFMAMRRAAYCSGADSAKVQRLLEIVEESASNGWKVVVFSYFREVLERLQQALDGAVHGPLTGSVAPAARQEMVDRFAATSGHAVLLSQIMAGGTGLNMQAASVVVLTEPQWKPSIEQQAVARCHRMGQVRRVHVHRLLAQDSVDQRMLEILETKSALFDEYVRRSALKDVSPDAVDIADTDAAKLAVRKAEDEIIDAESRRLGLA